MISQQQRQEAQQRQAQKYIQEVMTSLENDPSSLTGTERKFGSKYAEVSQRVRQIETDLTQLREQVRQAEARIRSLELQHQAENGRAAAFLESLVSLKFDVDEPVAAPHRPEVVREEHVPEDAKPAGDNGAQKPSPRAAVPPEAQA